MATKAKATRTPRLKPAPASPLELMEDFLNELVQHSARGTNASSFPPLIMRSDGLGYPTTAKAIRIAHRLAKTERVSSTEKTAKFSPSTFDRLSTVALGDTISHLKEHAAELADSSGTISTEKVLAFYRSTLDRKLDGATVDLNRHIPCHIFHSSEANAEITIGPVQFLKRDAWLERFVADQRIQAEVARAWESTLKPYATPELTGLERVQVNSILNTIGGYGWVGTVFIQNRDGENSHRNASVLVGLALDCLGVALDAREGALLNRAGVPFFRGGARLATTKDGKIVTGSTAMLPGIGGAPGVVDQLLAETKDYRTAAGYILLAYLAAHQSGRDANWLVERWVNALHWFGEARREASDFMAVVKYGCALDILSGAGGNLDEMTGYVTAACGVTHATNESGKEIPLSDLINDLFNDGRSALAHGEAFGLLADRQADRAQADVILQQVLWAVTEPLGDVVKKGDRMLTVHKKSQLRAFVARLVAVSKIKKEQSGNTN